MIEKAALEYLDDTRKNEVVEIEKRKYSTRTLKPMPPAQPARVELNTLTGLIDYVNESGEVATDEHMIHVADYDRVAVVSELKTEWKIRDTLAASSFSYREFRFNDYMDVESFLIGLQTQFVESAKLKELINYASRVIDVKETQADDDGISQTVKTKNGIINIGEIRIVNPVTLIARRTFAEVSQPETQYVFRAKKNSDDSIEFALFEADGGMWKSKAIHEIAGFLKSNLKDWRVLA